MTSYNVIPRVFSFGAHPNQTIAASFETETCRLNISQLGLADITANRDYTYRWIHFAVARQGTSARLFKNGMLVNTNSSSTYNFTDSTNSLYIGTDSTTGAFFSGYINNFRWITGTALYTANFIAPLAALTAVAGTKLLLGISISAAGTDSSGTSKSVTNNNITWDANAIIKKTTIPSLSASMKLWLDASDTATLYNATSGGSLAADGAYVARWTDKSGNDNDLLQCLGPTNNFVRRTGQQNGLGALEASGNSFMNCLKGHYPVDMYIVLKLKSITNHADVVGLGASNYDDFNSLTFGEYTQNRWHNGSTGFSRTPNAVASANESSLGYLLMQWSIGNNNFRIRRNGVQIMQSSSYTWGMPSPGRFTFGTRHTHINQLLYNGYFSGYYAEAICYNSQLTDADRYKVEEHLAWKWGIQGNLPVGHPGLANDNPTGVVLITGIAMQGQALTATNTLADLDGLGAFSYQWSSATTAGGFYDIIVGANASTFVPTEALIGKFIKATISYTDAHLTAEAVISAATGEILHYNSAQGVVTISGNLFNAAVLTSDISQITDTNGLPSVFNYKWSLSATPTGAFEDISGATSSSYTLQIADASKYIKLTVSFTDLQNGAGSVASAVQGPIQLRVAPYPPTSVTISSSVSGSATIAFTPPVNNGGSVVLSYTVTASPGGITNTGAGSPIVLSGLIDSISYTFAVTATNSVGAGGSSLSSSALTISPGAGTAVTNAAISTYIGTQASKSAKDVALEIRYAIQSASLTTEQKTAVKQDYITAMRAKVSASAGQAAIVDMTSDDFATFKATLGSVMDGLTAKPVKLIFPEFVGNTPAPVSLTSIASTSVFVHIEVPIGKSIVLSNATGAITLSYNGTSYSDGTNTYALGSTIYVGEKRYTLIGLGSLDLLEISAGGGGTDPYVTTIVGQTYQLPTMDAPIRFYQGKVNGNQLTINVSLRTIAKNELVHYTMRSLLTLKDKIPSKKYDAIVAEQFKDGQMAFFEKVYVSYAGSKLVMDLWDNKFKVCSYTGKFKTCVCSTDDQLRLSTGIYGQYKGQTLKVMLGAANLYLSIFDSPLIRNNVYLEAPDMETGNGVLVNTLSREDMTIADITAKDVVPRRDAPQARPKNTYFVDHDGYRTKAISSSK